jgi:hypothetical protein
MSRQSKHMSAYVSLSYKDTPPLMGYCLYNLLISQRPYFQVAIKILLQKTLQTG